MIVLKDVPYEDLQGIVEFIYHGEVSVDKECLDSFLKTAQTLRVKGLTDESKNANFSPSGAHQDSNRRSHHSRKSSKPEKRVSKQEEEEEIDDVEEDEIHDEEEMEEEEIAPNPFLNLSPQSITNAALAFAKANSELDDHEIVKRQQLLLGATTGGTGKEKVQFLQNKGCKHFD